MMRHIIAITMLFSLIGSFAGFTIVEVLTNGGPLGTTSVLGTAAFLVGMAGSSFAVGAAFVSRWTPTARQGTALGVYGLGTMG